MASVINCNATNVVIPKLSKLNSLTAHITYANTCGNNRKFQHPHCYMKATLLLALFYSTSGFKKPFNISTNNNNHARPRLSRSVDMGRLRVGNSDHNVYWIFLALTHVHFQFLAIFCATILFIAFLPRNSRGTLAFCVFTLSPPFSKGGGEGEAGSVALFVRAPRLCMYSFTLCPTGPVLNMPIVVVRCLTLLMSWRLSQGSSVTVLLVDHRAIVYVTSWARISVRACTD